MRFETPLDTSVSSPNDQGFSPIPAGWYDATIVAAEHRDTKAGTGSYISVRYNVTGPTHANRQVFANYNIDNPNPKAQEIGLQQMRELGKACGIPMLSDTDQLIGRHVQIKVSIQTSEQWGDKNEVKGSRSAGSTPPPGIFAAQPTAPGASAVKAPWQK
jgi:hypothetical protein